VPLDHADGVVPEVAQQPPEPRRAVPVGDDERVAADPGAPGRGREALRRRERVPAGLRNGQVGQIRVEVEERTRPA
jgi:hypothetical protein